MLLLTSIQEYLRFNAHQHHDVVSAPPFTLFFHATNSSEDANYAIPDVPEGSELKEGLGRLETILQSAAESPVFGLSKKRFHVLPHDANSVSAGGKAGFPDCSG